MADLLVLPYIIWKIFSLFWWIILPLILWPTFQHLWLNLKFGHFAAERYTPVSLEIKIPADIDKSPKIFDQVLAGLHAVKPTIVQRDLYKSGKFVPSVALEIYGSRDEIHFVIGTNKAFQPAIEANIYGQYPAAEITEVEHPLTNYPNNILDSKWNIFGVDLKLEKPDAYPIRTYPEFIDEVTRESTDPLAALMEVIGKLKPEEMVVMQLMIRPVKQYEVPWHKDGLKKISKVMGRAIKDPQQLQGMLANEAHDLLQGMKVAAWKKPEYASSSSKDDDPFMLLSPDEKEVVEAIARNIQKLGFQTKFRFLYLSPKDIWDVNIYYSLIGAVKQFSSQNLNGFKSDANLITGVYYFRRNTREAYRKRRFWEKFRTRDFSESGYILNTEELATIWHFPNKYVKIPLLQKTGAKKGEPPAILPYTSSKEEENITITEELKEQLNKAREFTVDTANDYFEKKFAKEKVDKDSLNKLSNDKGGPPSNLPI